MKTKIRIFTHRLCQEVDGVIDQLRVQGALVERVNLCQFPGGLKLALDNGSTGMTSHCAVGWVHDWSSFSFETEMTGLAREIALKESNAFVDGLLLRQDCNWLNSPDIIHVASNKPYQLHLATKLGIQVPPYIVTNDIRRFRQFQRQQGPIVIKTLAAAFICYGKRSLKFYTRRADSLIDERIAGLSTSPVIVQKEIQRAYETRVTVVDGRCYSVATDCRCLPKDIVDVRQLDYAAERHRFSPPPNDKEIEDQSLRITKALKLNYAGLDWATSLNGETYLFEVNPLASFKWFELVGAGDITTAITTALLKRATN